MEFDFTISGIDAKHSDTLERTVADMSAEAFRGVNHSLNVNGTQVEDTITVWGTVEFTDPLDILDKLDESLFYMVFRSTDNISYSIISVGSSQVVGEGIAQKSATSPVKAEHRVKEAVEVNVEAEDVAVSTTTPEPTEVGCPYTVPFLAKVSHRDMLKTIDSGVIISALSLPDEWELQ